MEVEISLKETLADIEFKKAVVTAMKYLADNCTPHHTIIITSTNAELLSGIRTTGNILDFIKD